MPPKRRLRARLILGTILLSLIVLGFDGPARGQVSGSGARASGPLEHGAYLWQRGWSDEVRASIDRHAADPALGELLILAAELDGASATMIAWDEAALDDVGALGLTIRVGPWSGPFGGPDDARLPVLLDAVRSTLARARGAGLELRELQLDFDAGTRALPGYARWVAAVAELAAPTPVTITALPDWLGSPELPALLSETEGWVLQVHGLRPMTRGESAEIFELDAAREAVERAAVIAEEVDRPLRVALPTYTYLVVRDPVDGGVEGIAAEQAPRRLDRDRFVRAEADPDALAELIAGWTADRPAALEGVVWFRLPVAGDRLAWSWPTLSAVIAGRAPSRQLRLDACALAGEPGVVELHLVNEGEAGAWVDAPLRVPLPERPLAADALDGFALGRSGAAALELEPRAQVRVGTGERRPVAWLRFSEGRTLTDTVCPEPPSP
ncbi:hypothetical protein ENSA5_19570 [Enhygromyxa salina]|uniref:DUF3142 domain-containing protein n=1 Tax=Enhygromyxa salina TaxID=215803 RepID=A0A2S9YD19_9BACT|nr:DUF3142 domain-containing protein [Enhygromyxa salina]PRQ03018.1 hypothetical protein ENSA5_19570 [Enhygromyxa salina]